MPSATALFADCDAPSDVTLPDALDLLARIADRANLVLQGAERIVRDPESRDRVATCLATAQSKARALRDIACAHGPRLENLWCLLVWQLQDYERDLRENAPETLMADRDAVQTRLIGLSASFRDIADVLRNA